MSAEGQAKELKAMQPQMPTEQEQIATLRAEVERLSRVERAFQEHLKDDVRESELRRLQPQGRQMDCDCPCDVCAIGTSKHCGKPPCDVAEAESSSAGPSAGQLAEMRYRDFYTWRKKTLPDDPIEVVPWADLAPAERQRKTEEAQWYLNALFPASQQVPQEYSCPACHEIVGITHRCAASQQVDMRLVAEEILSNCAAKYANPEIWCITDPQSVINRQIDNAAAVLQKAMGGKG